MAWCDYDKDREVPKEVAHAMLDLLDRINYIFIDPNDPTHGGKVCAAASSGQS